MPIVNPYKPETLFMGQSNSADPDQTPHNAASDQGLHGLLMWNENHHHMASGLSVHRVRKHCYSINFC